MPTAALTRARRLLQVRHRRQEGHFLAEGPHVVADALDAGAPVAALFVSDEADQGEEVGALADRARAAGATIHGVSEPELRSIADTTTPQGLVAVVAIPDPPPEPFARPAAWLLLDGVQDPGNVGTLLRAAEGFGLSGAVAGEGTADLWGGKVVRAAQGAHFRLALLSEGFQGVTLPGLLDELASCGGEVWAASLDGESVYECPPPPSRLVVALGSEARGLSNRVLDATSRRLSVPQRGRAESLNVAMAGTVVLAWLSRFESGASLP